MSLTQMAVLSRACTIFRQLIRCLFDVQEAPGVSAGYGQQGLAKSL
jgi:hypothetical protein